MDRTGWRRFRFEANRLRRSTTYVALPPCDQGSPGLTAEEIAHAAKLNVRRARRDLDWLKRYRFARFTRAGGVNRWCASSSPWAAAYVETRRGTIERVE